MKLAMYPARVRWYVIVREPDKTSIVDDFPDGENPKDFFRKHYNSEIYHGPYWEEKEAVKKAMELDEAREK